jgi:ribose transport system permease protein
MSTIDTTRRRPRAGELAPYAILALMIAALAMVPVLTQYTVRTANVYDIFQNFASYGLVALALGITIIAGEFDLSVSSMYLLGGMVAVLTGGASPLAGIVAALGTAILVGLIQGGLIARFRLNSMPVTLGGYLVVLGITYILGHNKSVLYDNFTVGLRLDEPVAQIFSIRSLVSLGIFVLAAVVLRYLRVGRDIRAIGGDRRAARVAGVSVDRLLVGVFVVSALGAALPGALLSYSLATASPTNIGFDVLTFSATAALIGGVSLSGGKGGAVGIAAGVLSLSVLQEILAILRSPDYVSSLITGGLLVVVTIVWAPDLSQWFRTTRVAAAIEDDRTPAEAMPGKGLP